ncbi:ArgS-related anticodon-binding protein NrtL [Streptomyces sp. NPDC002132]|uniref:ArgS-related anticodon-binding protein NrtL n=1 Tax=unclassified Streptomyces TaxID=2593676 RepID=UPI0033321595
MTPVELSRTVVHAVRRAVDAGELSVDVPSRVVVAPPGPGGCGDYATNVALQLARPAGQPPLRVAEVLQGYLSDAVGVVDVEITGPGFLNISLDPAAVSAGLGELVRRVLDEGLRYGHTDALAGRVFELRVPYEVRAEVLADALGRIVASQGGRVDVLHGEPVNLRPVPSPEDPAPLGLDAACWALLHPAPHDRPRITADHLVQREANPLFRVRYAHARARALRRNARALGFAADVHTPQLADTLGTHTADGQAPRPADVHTPQPADTPGTHPADGQAPRPAAGHTPHPADTPGAHPLLTLLADYPRVLGTAASRPHPDGIGAPSRLTRYLLDLADTALPFFATVLPRGDEKPTAAHRARLALAEAVGTVLAGGLTLLGIDAPDHL